MRVFGGWPRSDAPAGSFRFLTDDQVPWDTRPPLTVPTPHAVGWMNSSFTLVGVGLGVTASLVMFLYYCYEHRQIRLRERQSGLRRRLWTVDKVNACLIPLAIAVAFTAFYLMTRQ